MILILTDPSVGGTFLNWSLHYLSGHTEYFYTKTEKWEPLIDDPVSKINAHVFKPNQPLYVKEVYEFTNILDRIETDGFHSLYFHTLQDQTEHGSDMHQGTSDAISGIWDKFKKIIILNNRHPLYNAAFGGRLLTTKLSNRATRNQTFEEQHEDFINFFYKDSLDFWKSQKLNDIWDHREFLALNLRPFEAPQISKNVDLKRPHYDLNSFDLYCAFDKTVEDLFVFLDLDINQSRLSKWNDVYNRWRRIHYKRMLFVWYFDEIINCILNGHDMDLTRFELDIVQESCIQHYLIYNHGLNFKTWKLEKFLNTKQLHDLLETNTHPLSAY